MSEADRRYYDNLQALQNEFPTKRLLTIKDVASFLGCNLETAKVKTGVTKQGITRESCARALANLGR